MAVNEKRTNEVAFLYHNGGEKRKSDDIRRMQSALWKHGAISKKVEMG